MMQDTTRRLRLAQQLRRALRLTSTAVLTIAFLFAAPVSIAQEDVAAASPDSQAAEAANGTGDSDEEPRRRRHANNSCRRLTRQIIYYESIVDQAQQRGDDLWEANTKAQVERLTLRRRRLCPEYDQAIALLMAQKAYEDTKELLQMAGQAALRYFTFGTF